MVSISKRKLTATILKVLGIIDVRTAGDSFSADGWARYVNASTLGVDDVTKYHWFVINGNAWSQRPVVQYGDDKLSGNRLIIRIWVLNGTTNASVTLLRNTVPEPFEIIGIPKLIGGVVNFLNTLQSLHYREAVIA